MSSIGSGSNNSAELNTQVNEINDTAKAEGAAVNAKPIADAAAMGQPNTLETEDDKAGGLSGARVAAAQTAPVDVMETRAMQVAEAAATASGPAVPPDAGSSAGADSSSSSFGDNLSTAAGIATTGGVSIDQTNSEDLMTAFLKLQALDPSESMETKQLANEADHITRDEGRKAARQALKNANERLQEAQKGGDGPFGGIIGMLLDPLNLFGLQDQNQEKKDEAKNQVRNAETYLSQLTSSRPLSKDRAKVEEAMLESFAKLKRETTGDEDGVPKKGLAKDSQPKLEQVVGALMDVQGQDGDAAMLAQVPGTMAAMLTPGLEDAGVAAPNVLVRELAGNFVDELAKIPPAEGAMEQSSSRMIPGMDTGLDTALLADALDKEPSAAVGFEGDLAGAGMLDGSAALMKESKATMTQQSSIGA